MTIVIKFYFSGLFVGIYLRESPHLNLKFYLKVVNIYKKKLECFCIVEEMKRRVVLFLYLDNQNLEKYSRIFYYQKKDVQKRISKDVRWMKLDVGMNVVFSFVSKIKDLTCITLHLLNIRNRYNSGVQSIDITHKNTPFWSLILN